MGISGSDSTLNAHLELALSPLNASWNQETPVGLSFLLDMRVFMGNQLLRDSDACSMAHSLELRVPFVDLDLVEFSRSCFDHHKLLPDGGYGDDYVRSGSKRVLIHAMQDVLPLSVAHRPKRGFVVPVYSWLNGALRPMVEELCSPDSLKQRGLFDPELAAPCWRAFREGKGNGRPTDREMWTLLNLELWCREVFDAAPSADGALAAPSIAESN
jgi:asparagine synthase (glutamine-hydrolysing)